MKNKKINYLYEKYFCKLKERIANKYSDYRKKDKYLCRYRLKNGSVIVQFVDAMADVEKYKTWYEEGNGHEIIKISKTKSVRIVPTDVQNFEYKKISYFQRIFMDPIMAYLMQPVETYISFKNVMIAICLLFGVIIGFYCYVGYPINGGESISTFMAMVKSFLRLTKILIVYIVLFIMVAKTFTFSKALDNYYMIEKNIKGSVLMQFFELSMVPICFNIVLIPLLAETLGLLQKYGYFSY